MPATLNEMPVDAFTWLLDTAAINGVGVFDTNSVWVGSNMRFLPGLLLTQSNISTYEQILKTNLNRLKDGLLPKYAGVPSDYDAADAPLFAFTNCIPF